MSKNVVFYFSGTGNSLRVAKGIAEELPDCEVISIAALPVLAERYDRIGFVFPHYALGVPNLVRHWLETLALAENPNAYFFAVETYGAFLGNCLAQVRDLLRAKGAKLAYGGSVKMFANNIANYDMEGDTRQQAAEADNATRQIARELQKKQTNRIPCTNALFMLIYRKITASYPQNGLHFHASADCVGCGQCARLCPAGNITITDGRPVFGARCEWCMACIQWCPKAAIDYKSKTQGRTRYHHPAISIQDMCNNNKK